MAAERATLLRRFGIAEAARIGAGGESIVYALDAGRVLRVPQRGVFDTAALARQSALLDEIDGRLPFATTLIEEIGAGGAYVIEKRLPGRSMLAVLPSLSHDERAIAWRNYLDAAMTIGRIRQDDQPFGQIIADPRLTAATWRGYMAASLGSFAERNRASIEREAGGIEALLARALALLDEVPADPPHALVHGDYFPGNVLLDGTLAVSAVIDFSSFTLVGDPLLDIAGACVFPEMLAETTAEDLALLGVMAGERVPAGTLAFYRAYFAFFSADPALAAPPYPRMYGWGVGELRRIADGTLHRR